MSEPSIREPEDLDDFATTVFTRWSSDTLVKTFQNRYEALNKLCKQFFRIILRGMRPGMKSIYLTNKAMKATIMGYEDWSPFIPTSNCALHHKFKTNSGLLSHWVHQLEIIGGDEERKEELNDKIARNTPYSDLEAMLQNGMFNFSLPHILSPFVSCTIFSINLF